MNIICLHFLASFTDRKTLLILNKNKTFKWPNIVLKFTLYYDNIVIQNWLPDFIVQTGWMATQLTT